jgi:F0F1-type ATP synthase epsilon subunit
VSVGYIEVSVGYIEVSVGYIEVSVGYIEVSVGYIEDTADIDIWDTEDRQQAFQTSLSSVLESQQ